MPRTEEANRRIRETQRAKILEAAWRVFARKGRAITMADVAAEAALSYGLAYRYFASKDALLRALLEQRLRSSASRWQAGGGEQGTAGIRLKSLVSRLVESRRESPELAQLFRQVLTDPETPEDLRQLARRHGQRVEQALRRLIRQGQKSGEVAGGDAEQLLTAVLAYLDGLANMSAWNPARMQRHFPDAEIFLRIFPPPARGSKPAK